MPNKYVIPIVNLELSCARSTRNLSYDWIVNVTAVASRVCCIPRSSHECGCMQSADRNDEQKREGDFIYTINIYGIIFHFNFLLILIILL